MNYLLCHYSEIGLKGKNRSLFEKRLVSNIKSALPDCFLESVKRPEGRVVAKLTDQAEKGEIEDRLLKVFGLAYFSFAQKTESDLEKIKKEVIRILDDGGFSPQSFRVTTKRSDKSFPLDSPEVSRKIGATIVERFGWNVDLENFDLNISVEITRNGSYIYFKKVKGYGGLPVYSSGKAIMLLSGGIDSPVAGFKMMKRGLGLDYVHFHAYPLLSDDSIKKSEKIFEVLKRYSPESKLLLIPFGEVQKRIKLEIPEKFRIIFYRRVMLEIATKIADSRSASALVTGESLGQVSSQTLLNMRATEQATELPVLRPLVGENKEEIISIAKEIGTYDISILPDQDCCTLFNPRRPETNADLEEVLKLDEELDLEDLKGQAIENKRVLT